MVSTPLKRKNNALDADSQRASSNKKRKVQARFRSRSLDPLDDSDDPVISSRRLPAFSPWASTRKRSLSIDSVPESVSSFTKPSSVTSSRSRSGSSRSHSAISFKSRSSTISGSCSVTSPVRMDGAALLFHSCQPPVSIYRPFRNEVPETRGLDVPGEIKSNGKELPVRNLENFTFYGCNGAYLPFALIVRNIQLGARRNIRASGIVSRQLEDSDDGNSDIMDIDAELLVSLQSIEDFWTDYNAGQLETVWVMTKHAWYILRNPAPLYTVFYQPFWVAHHLTWLIAKAARDDRDISFEVFCYLLEDEGDEETMSIMGRELLERDFENVYVILYIAHELSSVTDAKRLRKTPLIKYLAERATANNLTMEELFEREGEAEEEEKEEKADSDEWQGSSEEEDSSEWGSSDKPRQTASGLALDSQTVTMPLVHELTTGIFLQTLIKAGKTLDSHDRRHKLLQAPEPPTILHPDAPTNVEWEEPIQGADGYFRRMLLDGEPYSVGEVVMVKPGTDDLSHRAKSASEACSESTNELVNKVWFCKVIYFCDELESPKSRKRIQTAHVQWYQHGSRTILQETAHPYGLFALAECGDIPVGSIFGLCNVLHLEPGEKEPNDYHCSFLWDADEARFLDQSIISGHSEVRGNHPNCPCCDFTARRARQAAQETDIYSDDYATVRGVEYHKNDFVYIAAQPNSPYLIGQIRRFVTDSKYTLANSQVELTRLGRYDDVAQDFGGPQPHVKKDEARLFMTKEVKRYALPLLEGKCFVSDKDQALSLDGDWNGLGDHFYIDRWAKTVDVRSLDELLRLNPRFGSLAFCERCVRAAQREQEVVQEYTASHPALRAMELFAGAGGLSTGLESAGPVGTTFIKTHWAVELSTRAAATFQANHPDAIVYDQDTNTCLQNAIDVKDGQPCKPLRSLATGTELPPMPQPGDVDLIAGGFPCQSFSGLNHYKRSDDNRTTLVANMLSYVEFYRPRYVLMENVKGLLQHHIREAGSEVDPEEVDKCIKMGIVKFVLRALTCLGYQATLKVLQAADYGSPQRRERVIFWGAQRSHFLPEYPFPTHVAPGYRNHDLTLPTYDKLISARRSARKCAPHRALVIADAISDLPGYDWKNPHAICSEDEGEADQVQRRQKRYKQVSAVATPKRRLAGFLGPVHYAMSPRTTYQRWVRDDNAQVTLHCSRSFSAPVVERVWHVCSSDVKGPYDLPRELWTNVMNTADERDSHTKLNLVWKTRFSRLQWNEPFTTALTRCRPFSKGSKVFHPTQKRIITAREFARSQGFPDSYEFVQSESDDRPEAWAVLLDDIYKQIGNAVPVQLAYALGQSLGKALVKKWLQGRDRESTGSVVDQGSDFD